MSVYKILSPIAAALVALLFAHPVAAQPVKRPAPVAKPGPAVVPYQPHTETIPIPPPVVLPPPSFVPPDVPNRPLDAAEAARLALAHQASVGVARGVVTSARGRTMQAHSLLYPTVTVSGSYTDQWSGSSTGSSAGVAIGSSLPGGSASVFGTATSLSGGATSGASSSLSSGSVGVTGFVISATLRQLLYDFNHTRDLVKQARESERAAQAGLTKTQQDLVLQVKQAFYTYVQNLRTVTVNESNVKNQQDHLALAEARFRAGVGLPADVVRSQTAVSDAIFNLTLARNNAAVARVTLAQLMGIDPRTPIQPADSHETGPSTANLDNLYNTALAIRPDVLQARANVAATRYGERAARSGNAPTVSGNINYSARGPDFYPRVSTVTAGVSVNWTPWDSGLTAGRVLEARGNLESAQAQLELVRETVLSDVSQSYLNQATAQQRVVSARSEVANAEESVRLAEGRYKAGLGQLLDVLDAQTALLTAQTNLVNAQAALDQANASLLHAVGTPVTP